MYDDGKGLGRRISEVRHVPDVLSFTEQFSTTLPAAVPSEASDDFLTNTSELMM